MDQEKLALSLGLKKDATQEEIDAKIADLQENQKEVEPTEELPTDSEEVKKLKAQLKQQQDDKVTALIGDAITDGKITGEEKDQYTSLATSDYDNTKLILDKMSKQGKPSDIIGDPAKEKGDEIPADSSTWNYMDWSKNDAKGLAKMRVDNPEQYEELVNAYKEKRAS